MFADLSSCGLPHATTPVVETGPGPGPGPGGNAGVQGNALAKWPQPASPPSSKAGVQSTPSTTLWAPPTALRRHLNLPVNDVDVECCKDSGKPSTCKSRIKDSDRGSVPSSNSPAAAAGGVPPNPPPPPAPPPPPLPPFSSRTGLLEKKFIHSRSSTPPHGPLEGTWENIRGAVSGPKSGPSRWTQNDLMAALSMVKSGTPIKPAAERCNIPVMTLWRRTRALGIVSSKVQCGFRYPAARKRTKPDAENAILEIKPEPPDTHLHVKSEPRTNSYLAQENGSDYNMFLNYPREDFVLGCKITKDRSPLRTVYRERSLEVSPRGSHKNNSRLSSRGEDISKSGRRENSGLYSKGEAGSPDEDHSDLIREENPQSPKWKGETGLHSLRYVTSYECPRSMAEENNPHISQHSDANSNRKPVVVAAERASRTTSATGTATVVSSSSSSSCSHPTEGPDRFCAWVDIVLEGRHCQERKKEEGEQLDSPEDLSTHPQHPLSPPQSTSSSTSPSSNTLPYPPS
ncbi:uncharacterized protein [Palaemon carinicauda]|uniref:uncharacterized protein n=1 Tax=Palaemon carinicauda TaxID=392227 RepID=UPI0035B62B98